MDQRVTLRLPVAEFFVYNRFLTQHPINGGSASNVASASSVVLVLILAGTYTSSSHLADAMLFIGQKLST